MRYDNMEVEWYRGYACVWSGPAGGYTLWRNGQQVGTCRPSLLRATVDGLERERLEITRTHELPAYAYETTAFEDWLADLNPKWLKRAFLAMFAAWMAFAVWLFMIA